MPNKLINENSPYLLQHARNPVDWYPWCKEAIDKAKAEDKPIFLSIGYAACHWCHVMAHESFEDAGTAALMNESFINIKVDREERPDLDSIYMRAVTAMTGQGGWPMSVFLTPDGKPFFGGTYFPPVRRYNMPAFRELLTTIARLWREDRTQLLESSRQIGEHLRQAQTTGQPVARLDEDTLNQAVMSLGQEYDWKSGGWGQAPKFPQPMVVEFLLRRATRGDKFARDMAADALRAMSRGGMYDLVGGGFARYSTDNAWRVPHFEKMLYDNAQLALVYLHGWLVCREPGFRAVCEETLDFLLREMTHPLGGFFSSLDADSEGEEGKFYTWTPEEIQTALMANEDIALVTAAYQITPSGNFEGSNVLQSSLSDEELAERFMLPVETITRRLGDLRKKLLHARSKRQRPATDDKVLVAWNALATIVFAEAARYLKRPDFLLAAQRNAGFVLQHLVVNGRLMRSWREGKANHLAYLEDYAAMILGLLALYQSDANVSWYRAALSLAEMMTAQFTDSEGGFFDTGDDHEVLLLRPKDLQDNATPCGNALAACALLQLAAYEGRGDWRSLAKRSIQSMYGYLSRYPTAFAQWLQAADLAVGPVLEVAILGDPVGKVTQALTAALWDEYRPRLAAAIAMHPAPEGSPALLANRPLLEGQPTAYVCKGFVCRRPVNRAGDFLVELET